MRNKILPIILAAFLIIIFLVFYKGLQKPNIYIPKTNIEKDIPIFIAQTFDINNQIDSKDIFKKNKFYLLNIWASWCAPCKDEHPFLMELKNKKNIEIIGLNYKDNKNSAKNFLKDYSNPYSTIFFDKDGVVSIEWGAYGIPETFLIYNKKIIKKIIGPIDRKSLIELKKLIK